MPYLKHEMREIFEKHSNLAFYDNNSRFEDGLLEKILNLAFASLTHYSSKRWEITAVCSPVHLQKLSKAAGDKKITECAYALIVFDSSSAEPDKAAERSISHEIDMLSLSIGYAAKFYCVNNFIIKNPDNQTIAREFSGGRKGRAVEIVCLGFFRDRPPMVKDAPVINFFSQAVKII